MTSFFGCNGMVNSMTTDGSENIYICGDFNQVNYGGDATPITCSGFASYNTRTKLWNPFSLTFGNNSFNLVAVNNNDVYLADASNLYYYNLSDLTSNSISQQTICMFYSTTYNKLVTVPVSGPQQIIFYDTSLTPIIYLIPQSPDTPLNIVEFNYNSTNYIILSGLVESSNNVDSIIFYDVNLSNPTVTASTKQISYGSSTSNPQYISGVTVDNNDCYQFIFKQLDSSVPYLIRQSLENIANNTSQNVITGWDQITNNIITENPTNNPIFSSIITNNKLYYAGSGLKYSTSDTMNIFNIDIATDSVNVFGGLVNDLSDNGSINTMVELNGYLYVGGQFSYFVDPKNGIDPVPTFNNLAVITPTDAFGTDTYQYLQNAPANSVSLQQYLNDNLEYFKTNPSLFGQFQEYTQKYKNVFTSTSADISSSILYIDSSYNAPDIITYCLLEDINNPVFTLNNYSGNNVYFFNQFNNTGSPENLNLTINYSTYNLIVSGGIEYNNIEYTQEQKILLDDVFDRFIIAHNSQLNLLEINNGDIFRTDGYVNVIKNDPSGNVYVGGRFSKTGYLNTNNIAKYNIYSRSWESFGGGVDGEVFDLILDASLNMYIGGSFNNSINLVNTIGENLDTKSLSKWDNSQNMWVNIGDAIGTVYALELDTSNNLYIGGNFTNIASTGFKYLARLNINTSTWDNVDNFSSFVTGGTYVVSAIKMDFSNNLIVGGDFTDFNGNSQIGDSMGPLVINNFNHWSYTRQYPYTYYNQKGIVRYIGMDINRNIFYSFSGSFLQVGNLQPTTGTTINYLNINTTINPLYPSINTISSWVIVTQNIIQPYAFDTDLSNNMYFGGINSLTKFSYSNPIIITDDTDVSGTYTTIYSNPSLDSSINTISYNNITNDVQFGGEFTIQINNTIQGQITINNTGSIIGNFIYDSVSKIPLVISDKSQAIPAFVPTTLDLTQGNNPYYRYIITSLPQYGFLFDSSNNQIIENQILTNPDVSYIQYVSLDISDNTDNFTYVVNDGYTNTNPINFDLSIILQPIAFSQDLSMNVFDTRIRIDLSGIDPNPIPEDIVYFIGSNVDVSPSPQIYPENGYLTDLSGNVLRGNNFRIYSNSLYYVPYPNINALSDSFSFFVGISGEDFRLYSSNKEISIELHYLPVAESNTYFPVENTITEITLQGSCIDTSSILYYRIDTDVLYGTLYFNDVSINSFPFDLSANNKISYQSNSDISQNDYFTYTVINILNPDASASNIISLKTQYYPEPIDENYFFQQSKTYQIQLGGYSQNNHALNYFITAYPNNGGIIKDISNNTITLNNILPSNIINYTGTSTGDVFKYKVIDIINSLPSQTEGIIDVSNISEPQANNISMNSVFGTVSQVHFVNNYIKIQQLPTYGNIYYDTSLISASSSIIFYADCTKFSYLIQDASAANISSDSFEYSLYDPILNYDSSNASVDITIYHQPTGNNTQVKSFINQNTQIDISGINYDSSLNQNLYIKIQDGPNQGHLYIDPQCTVLLTSNNIPNIDITNPITIYYKSTTDASGLDHIVYDLYTNYASMQYTCTVNLFPVPAISDLSANIRITDTDISFNLSASYNGNETLDYYIDEIPTYGSLYDDTSLITYKDYKLTSSKVIYVPDASASIPQDTFTFYIIDDYYKSSSKEFAVNIHYPISIKPQQLIIPQNKYTQIELYGYTQNIFDTLTYTIQTLPDGSGSLYDSNGSQIMSTPITLNNNFVYYLSTDSSNNSFTYTVTDAYFDSSGIVNIIGLSPPVTYDISLIYVQGVSHNINLISSNQNILYGNLSYIITSLPSEADASLSDPFGGDITTVPYKLKQNENIVNFIGGADCSFNYIVTYDNNDLSSNTSSVSINIDPSETPNNQTSIVFYDISSQVILQNLSSSQYVYRITSLPQKGDLYYGDHKLNNGDLDFDGSLNNFYYLYDKTPVVFDVSFTYVIYDTINFTDSSEAIVTLEIIYYPDPIDQTLYVSESEILPITLDATDPYPNAILRYTLTNFTIGTLFYDSYCLHPIPSVNTQLGSPTIYYKPNGSTIVDQIDFFVENKYVGSTGIITINIDLLPVSHNVSAYVKAVEDVSNNIYMDVSNNTDASYVIYTLPEHGKLYDINSNELTSGSVVDISNIVYIINNTDPKYESDSFSYYATKSFGKSNIANFDLSLRYIPEPEDQIILFHYDLSGLDISLSVVDFPENVIYKITSLPTPEILTFNGSPVNVGDDVSENLVFFWTGGGMDVNFDFNARDNIFYDLSANANIRIIPQYAPSTYDLTYYANENQLSQIDLSAISNPSGFGEKLYYYINTGPSQGTLYSDPLGNYILYDGSFVDIPVVYYKSDTPLMDTSDSFTYYARNNPDDELHDSNNSTINININLFPIEIILGLPTRTITEVTSIDRTTPVGKVISTLQLDDPNYDASAIYTYFVYDASDNNNIYLDISGNELILAKSILNYPLRTLTFKIKVVKFLYDLHIYHIQTFVLDIIGEPPIPCLCADTEVLTPSGYVNITKLVKGQYVVTDDKRHVRITGIYRSKFKGCDKTYPYVVKKNSIAPNYPLKTVRLSAYHLIKYKNKWICPKTCGWFKQDKSLKVVIYYHIQLEDYITDHLVVNQGTVVESMGCMKDNKIRDKTEWHNRSRKKYIRNQEDFEKYNIDRKIKKNK